MAQTLSLVELAQKVEADAARRQDFVADTRRLRMDDEGVIEMEGNDNLFRPLPLAHAQIADRLSVPKRFYDRMLSDHPDVLAYTVNTLFEKEPEQRMLRTYMPGDDVLSEQMGAMPPSDMRAFLSSRYRRIDNLELMKHAILPELLQGPMSEDLRVLHGQVTDSRMYIKVVSPRLEGEVERGDVIQGGFVISNSEVGKGSLSIAFFCLRLVCTNGMVGESLLRKYHVGRNVDQESAEALFSQETLQADDHAIMLKARDMVRNALDQNAFGKQLDKMREAKGQHIQREAVKPMLEKLSQAYSLNEGESTSLMEQFFRQDDPTRYGVVNALTAAAQETESYERQIHMEKAGHALLNMAPSTFNRMAEVA